MKNKGMTRRFKQAAWVAFMLPLMSIGATTIAEGPSTCTDTHNEVVCKETLCAASAPTTLFTGYDGYHAHYYEQPYFVDDYFRYLTEHFPTNNCGNCGYTAAAMLLCYYDTYWNENIISRAYESDPAYLDNPSEYKCSSPGIRDFYAEIELEQKYRPEEGASRKEWQQYNLYLYGKYSKYLDEMAAHSNDNLISYLYDIALGKTNQPHVWDFNQDHPTTETTMPMVKDLLNHYFNERGLSDFIEAKLEELPALPDFLGGGPGGPRERRMLRNSAISHLVKGQPIIYSGDIATDSGYYDTNMSYISGNGHAAIAYRYDTETRHIFGHIGWKGDEKYSCMDFDKVFGDFDSFIYLDVKPELEFSHPNERFIVGNRYYSACDLKSHVHADEEHRAIVSYGDPDYHALQCICGDVEYEEHEFGDPVPYDNQNHAFKCRCGHTIYEAHTHDETVWKDPSKHAYKCRCGATIGEGYHLYQQRSINKFVCVVCGDVIYTNPYPILY